MKILALLLLFLGFIPQNGFAKKAPPARTADVVCAGLEQGELRKADYWRNLCAREIENGTFDLDAVGVCDKLDDQPVKMFGTKGTRSSFVIGCLKAIKNKKYTSEGLKPCTTGGDNAAVITCLNKVAEKSEPPVAVPATVPAGVSVD